MQARVARAQVAGLEALDRLDGLRSQELDLVGQICELLEGVEQHRRGAAQQRRCLARDDLAVGQLDRGGRLARGLGQFERRTHDRAVHAPHAHAAHQQGDARRLHGLAHFLLLGHEGLVVAANDLLARGLPAGLVVDDAVARHVDAHIRGALVRGRSEDLLEEAVQDREDFDVAVVVDRLDPVRLQVEGINHVDVIEVGGGRLVGNVHRVIERNIPDREGLPLRVPRLDPALVVVVQLRQAGRHLAGARAGSRHDHEVAASLHVLVGAVSLVRDDALDVRGVAGDREVAVDADAELLEALLHLGGCLVVVRPLRDDDGTDVQATLTELIDLAQNLVVVGGSHVGADLAAREVLGVNGDDDLDLVSQFAQHTNLVVGRKTGQNTRRVHVVDQLAAELQIQLSAEFASSLGDVSRLHLDVLITIKTDAVHASSEVAD